MKFLVLFEDAREADPNIRNTHMRRHLCFLEAHAGHVDAAGPLADNEDRGLDGCWVVDMDGHAEVEELIRSDPFWPTGLRKSYRIIPWKQVYANGRRLINPSV